MIKDEEGFSTPFALALIFALSVLTGAIAILITSNQKRMESFKRTYKDDKESHSLVMRFSEDLQSLVDEDSDNDFSLVLIDIASKYSQYSLEMKDVSTGINENFLSRKILEMSCISNLIKLKGNEIKTEYGWINEKYAGSAFMNEIEKNIGSNKLPLCNTIPYYNLYFMDCDFIKAILELCKIPDAEEKAQKLFSEKEYKTIDVEGISEMLRVNKSHEVFAFLGTKTTFWEVTMQTETSIVKAIFAGMPSEKDISKIGCYELMKFNYIRKTGN